MADAPDPSMRDQRLIDLLAACKPVEAFETQWSQPMRIASYLHELPLIDELIVSVRCLVQVEHQLVVCTDVSGTLTVLPGGRREPGETLVETACREIHEETGWTLLADSLEQIGFIHLTNLGTPQPGYPYPDALHLVMTGQASDRAADDWVDTEGFVLSSTLEPLATLDVSKLEFCSATFIDALRQRRSS